MSRYRLKLTSLKFISAVDAGAQGEISNVALLKRHDANGIEATCQVVKVDASLGLVFGWALASSLDGGKTQHVDLQGDAIQNEDLIKVAADFMESAAASDVMHDDAPDGRIVFAMPLIPEVNAALGISSDVHGLAIAMKPSPETFKRFQSGELKAFSIAGTGERAPLVEKIAPGSIATAAIAASLARESPRSKAPVRKDSKMTLEEALEEIKNLKAKLAELDKSKEDLEEVKDEAEKRATLTDAQRTYHKSLDKADAKAFLAKSASERDGEIVKSLASDPVTFTCADGTEIRKSQGDLMLRFAKQADEALKTANIEKSARELTELTKRATDTLGALAGKDSAHVALLKAAEGIADEKSRTAAIETLKAANQAMASMSIAKGANDGSEPVRTAPQGELDTAIAKHMTDHKVDKTAATAAVLNTPEGARLYGAVVKSLRSGK